MEPKIIITGATRMVGEGVMLECLSHPDIAQVLSVVRNPSGAGQKNIKTFMKILSALYPVFKVLMPNSTCTLQEVALALIASVKKGYPLQVLEVRDIKVLAKSA